MPIVPPEEFLAAKLDYVIVGGGTAGLVVATRLSENPNVIVGVIEAGKYHEREPKVNVPGMGGQAINDPDFDWSFRTVSEKYLNGREVMQSRGKGLGGSSMINILAFVRPGKVELDAWEELGNPGWNWETVLKYMKKSESLQPEIASEEASRYAASPIQENHGTGGPIAKSFPTYVTETHSALLDAMAANRLPRNPDHGGGVPIGGYTAPVCIDRTTATRSYSASGYYAPNSRRPNMLILTEAQATKINLTEASNGTHRASSVSFIHKGDRCEVSATKDVILCASSFVTSQLLELSGIGDSDHLSAYGIDSKIDLPGVGENLQDHGFAPLAVEIDPSIKTPEALFDPMEHAKQLELYEKERKGMYASSFGSIFGFLPAPQLAGDDSVQRWKSQASLGGSPLEVFKNTKPSVKKGIEKQYELLKRFMDNPEQPFAQLLCYNGFGFSSIIPDLAKSHFIILAAYTHPFHRGSVHIQSNNIDDRPIIRQNYLSNDADLDIIVKAVRFAEKLIETEPLKSLIVKRVEPTGTETEEELREWVRNTFGSTQHPAGTCAMLPREMGGVVDSRLKVYGTENLRVIDTSIIPMQVSCNIQSIAYAVGEMGADIIKGIL
ncbi:hypothetical protein EIP91_011798 [Steccherinum ochraceum]|uniref:Glucose-methanol-choline oxidoreductase N-terminal domain-containing protein n=1 Tax=Steccherinum ochraceum TaxID=92696 RepID=A0A4R0RY06_9APHY|nr:hypothetical protein EIP91_011798 [Steccherinum ochraceum]